MYICSKLKPHKLTITYIEHKPHVIYLQNDRCSVLAITNEVIYKIRNFNIRSYIKYVAAWLVSL